MAAEGGSATVAAEGGSATVAAMLMVLVLLAVTSAAAVLGAAVSARHRAQAAADLAALSAAQRVPSGPAAACETATHVARSMGGQLIECAVDDLDVIVRVGVAPALGGTLLAPASAVARAGPAGPEH
ncbi:Rv3654c family TadE-like protein [Mycobacterium sp. smrl_JER01]|uniref:Rv3654c family TadE-like protein n=1 Tax=Mycobacterium sp. smrl_JER01 TaxID=3402633 RepID=UPI003AC744C0